VSEEMQSFDSQLHKKAQPYFKNMASIFYGAENQKIVFFHQPICLMPA
jgi:hypothetical protein